MRVGIIGLLHESNTFIAEPTTLAHFEQDTLLVGEAVRERFAGVSHEIGGFFAGLQREGVEAVPIFAARAIPYGPIATESFTHLIATLRDELAKAGSLDGVLVAPHGATVCQSIADADGHWLTCVRNDLGDEIPLVGTLDAHANLSHAMVEATDALIAYRTNPHLDQHDRGMEAARLIVRTIRGEVTPVQRASFPSLAINIERQMTDDHPLADLLRLADESRQRPGVLSNSILLGFPYADVPEMGSAVLVVTDNDRSLAEHQAVELADFMLENRQRFDGPLINIDEALRQSQSLDGRICLLDMGDNVGGGSPGDSTHIARAIMKQGIPGACVCINDPQAVQIAKRSELGTTVTMPVGGKTDRHHGEPITESFRVLGKYDGKFTETKVRHGGLSHYDQGLSILVQSTDPSELTILLTSQRTPPFSLNQLTSCGIDPTRFRLLITKGVNAPVAAYREVCQHFVRVNSPGCTTADIRQLNYQHRRRPMFPFERD